MTRKMLILTRTFLGISTEEISTIALVLIKKTAGITSHNYSCTTSDVSRHIEFVSW